jgi:hypothetical protein
MNIEKMHTTANAAHAAMNAIASGHVNMTFFFLSAAGRGAYREHDGFELEVSARWQHAGYHCHR